MGDADVKEAVIKITANEVETWMDEALAVVDEGFENLLTLVTNLNQRTKDIQLELKVIEGFRQIFFALNLLIVPVIFAILICYGIATPGGSGQGIEAVFQILVMLLMFMAACVGLPFYVTSIWESYKTYVNMREDTSIKSIPNDTPGSPAFITDSLLSLLTNGSSVERLTEFTRLLYYRMPRNMRADLERMRKDTHMEKRFPPIQDTSEVEMERANNESVEPIEKKQDQSLDGGDGQPNETEFPIRYQFQVRVNEESPDLSVRLEPVNEIEEVTENEETVEEQDISEPPAAAYQDAATNTEIPKRELCKICTFPKICTVHLARSHK